LTPNANVIDEDVPPISPRKVDTILYIRCTVASDRLYNWCRKWWWGCLLSLNVEKVAKQKWSYNHIECIQVIKHERDKIINIRKHVYPYSNKSLTRYQTIIDQHENNRHNTIRNDQCQGYSPFGHFLITTYKWPSNIGLIPRDNYIE
jgi:hypothetical protein